MDFDRIKLKALDKAIISVMKEFKEEDSNLILDIQERDPKFAEMVKEQRDNITIILEITKAMLEEYHKELMNVLKSRS